MENGLVSHIDSIENQKGEYNFPQDFFKLQCILNWANIMELAIN